MPEEWGEDAFGHTQTHTHTRACVVLSYQLVQLLLSFPCSRALLRREKTTLEHIPIPTRLPCRFEPSMTSLPECAHVLADSSGSAESHQYARTQQNMIRTQQYQESDVCTLGGSDMCMIDLRRHKLFTACSSLCSRARAQTHTHTHTT